LKFSKTFNNSFLINRLNFIDDQDIQWHHLGVNSSVNALDPITEEVVLEALEIILNPRNYPMTVMCNLGRHRTGIKRQLNFMLFSLIKDLNSL
jgi:protein tyrosine/serine phosphatase